MISKPIITIDKFSGMSDQGGTFYLDGFTAENENSVQSLDENYRVIPLMTQETLEDDKFDGVNGMIYITGLTGSTWNTNTQYNVSVNSSGGVFGYYDGNLVADCYIAGGGSSGNYFYSDRPDIAEMESGSIIFTSARHVSYILRGICKAGSGTDKIVDTAGRDFTTLGFAAGDRVTNIITGETYVVSSISTTDDTNDTLNFTAGVTNSEDDEFMLTKLEWKDFGYDQSARDSQFNGQLPPLRWARPIRQSSEIGGGGYLIGNGNYIALLSKDEDTFDDEFKQLPFGFQLLAMEVGNLGDVLVSAYNKQGDGYLLYWDGFSEGWNEIIKVSASPMALKPYKSGWVYFVEGTLYFTDGRSVEKIIAHPDASGRFPMNVNHFNGIEIHKDKIFLAVSGNSTGRARNGIYVFDQSGLSFFKCDGGNTTYTTQYATPRCLRILNTTGTSDNFSINNELIIGGEGFINTVREYTANSSANKYRSVMFKLDLGQETKIKEVWLNLQHSPKVLGGEQSSLDSEITVNVGDGSLVPFRYLSAEVADTTNVSNTKGDLYPGNKDEVYEIFDAGLTRQNGERFHIETITNRGTVDETWTISPALSDATTNDIDLRGLGVRKGETKTIGLEDLSKPIRFNVNFIGSTLYLEIVVRGGTLPRIPVSISNIQLF